MKKIFNLLIVAIMTFGVLINVSALDKTVTFTKTSKLVNYRNIIYTDLTPVSELPPGTTKKNTVGTTYKEAKTASGTTFKAYCFNHEQDAPNLNDELKHRNLNATEAKYEDAFIYILDNGHGGTWNSGVIGYDGPSNNTTLRNEERYYITQLAIWMLQEEIGLNGIAYKNLGNIYYTGAVNNNYKDAARRLVEASKKHKQVDPSINITGQTQMYLTADKKYYRSGDFTVSGNGYSTYKVNLTNAPAGTKIVIANTSTEKNSGDSLAAGTKFYVRIPVSKVSSDLATKVQVTATGTLKRLAIYEPTTAGRQDVGVLYKEAKPVAKEVKLSANPVGSLSVLKVAVDTKTGQETKLSGATITVTKAGDPSKKWTWTTTSTNNPYTIPNLPIGTYTITETHAPSGYTKATTRNVTIKAGEPYEVKLENTKDNPPRISKQDITTKAELPGAHLVLTDSFGKVIDEWDSTTSPHFIKEKLLPGMTYTLKETIAPEGYQPTEEVVTFKTNNKGEVDDVVVMYNTPVTPVKISKQDITTGEELPGAHLVVKDSTGKVIDEWISTTTPHYLPELPDGKYTLIETISPPGYGLSEEVIPFEIKSNGVEQTVVMTNAPIPETADMNFTIIVIGLIATVALAGFSIFKLNKQSA